EILHKPYIDQIVISPHVYPPSVTHASNDFQGEGLWNRMNSSFGYLTQQGYEGKVFPVAIGEFGSFFRESKDIQSLNDMTQYFQLTGAANDGMHKAIPHW